MFTRGPALIGSDGDPYFDSVVLLLHADGVNGTRAWVDSSKYHRTLTETGTNSISNVRSKFGGTSALFNDGAIVAAVNANMELGSSPWTIEFWINPTSNTFGVLCKYISATPANPIPIAISGEGGVGTEKIRVKLSSDGVTYGFNQVFPSSGGGAFATDVWSHIAVVFDGTNIKVFRDGTLLGTAANSTAVRNTADEWQIGRDKSGGGFMGGYLDDFRMTIGVARYSANFTPPADAFKDY